MNKKKHIVKGIYWVWPPHTNSDHQDYYMFNRDSLFTFIYHCYCEGATSKVYSGLYYTFKWGSCHKPLIRIPEKNPQQRDPYFLESVSGTRFFWGAVAKRWKNPSKGKPRKVIFVLSSSPQWSSFPRNS